MRLLSVNFVFRVTSCVGNGNLILQPFEQLPVFSVDSGEEWIGGVLRPEQNVDSDF